MLSRPVVDARELPPAGATLFDVAPRHLLRIAGAYLPEGYRRKLAGYRYGPGVFKVDYALDGPIPWQAKECARAGTVHLGGTFEEIAASERTVWRGEPAERPYALAGSAEPVRPDSRSGRQTHGLGLLPRPEWLDV